jgi:MATE family multidrug resistance protein
MKPINRDILKLAGPSILANMTIPLVGMVDIAVAGHLGKAAVSSAEGAAAGSGLGAAMLIGGITIGSMLFDLLYWNFEFLRVGTGGLTAQAYGRGDSKAQAGIFFKSTGIALISSLALIAIQWLFVNFVFLFVKCSPEVRILASQYFYIRIWAAPATLSLMALKGWFIGMQDGITPMADDIIVNIVNIFASIGLALHWGFGFNGVALGTVIAQYSGLIFAIVIVLVKYRKRVFEGFGWKDACKAFRDKGDGKFLSLNRDLIIRSACFICIYIGFTMISANYGDLMLASSAIMMKLLMIFSYFVDGFAYAGEALTGRYVGMKNRAMVSMTVDYVFRWSIGAVAFFMLIYGALGTPLIRLMTSDASVIEACQKFLPWLIVMPVIGCAAFTWDGIYAGATASKGIRNSAIGAVVAFFAVWFIGIALLNHFSGMAVGTGAATLMAGTGSASYNVMAIHILMAAYFAHLLFRTIYLTAIYKRSIL